MKYWNLLVVAVSTLSLVGADFDVLIINGRIVDGTGTAAFHADVGIREGKIIAVGKINSATVNKDVIDARGLIVAPGFIDVHTHAEDILEMPAGENFIRMGVTTLVLGNCGSSALEVGKMFERVEATNVAPNVATLFGHNTVRRAVMGGNFDKEPTDEEMAGMKERVANAMKEGAVGFSTGLIYLPGTFSKTEEIVELARVAGEFGGIYVSHMRDEGLEIDRALDELIRIAIEGSIRAHISHIKLSGKSAWGRAADVLATVESARSNLGLDVTQDQYVYTASSTGISQLVPDWAREGNKFADRVRDPATKEKMRLEMKFGLERRGFEDFSYAVVANYEPDPSINGLNIVEIAQKRRGAATIDDQIEVILEIQSRASGVFHSMGEEDLRTFLKHPNTMLASDSGVRRFKEGVPHPRGYGNNARALGRYVNELGVLRLEEAVRKMTSLPANTFRLPGRGQIGEGFWADLVVFDLKKVSDRATFPEPHQYAVGFEYVLVNGVKVIDKGAMTEARPGKPVRFK